MLKSFLGFLKPLANNESLLGALAQLAIGSLSMGQFVPNDFFSAHFLLKLVFGRWGRLQTLDSLLLRNFIGYLFFIQLLCKTLLENFFESMAIAKTPESRFALRVTISALVNLFCSFSDSLLKSNPSNQVHLPIELRVLPKAPQLIDSALSGQAKPKDLLEQQFYFYDVILPKDMKELVKGGFEKELLEEMTGLVENWTALIEEKYKKNQELKSQEHERKKNAMIMEIRKKFNDF